MAGVANQHQLWLLYDGDCSFCQRWVNWAGRRGARAAVSFLPCQSAVDLRKRAGIEEVECGHSAILVECDSDRVVAVHRAAAAINGVMRRLPGSRNAFWRFISAFYFIPGIKQLEELGYRVVANLRHRFGKRSCKIPQ